MSRQKAEDKRAMRYARLRESRRHLPTLDDWSPSYIFLDGKYTTLYRIGTDFDAYEAEKERHPQYVEGKIFLHDDPSCKIHKPRYFFRICFWGADDSGMEWDLQTPCLAEAEREFERWSKWLGEQTLISRDSLRLLGFVNA